jgi:hypothetical protein
MAVCPLLRLAAGLLLAVPVALAAPDPAPVAPGSVRPFIRQRSTADAAVVALDRQEWRLALSRSGPVRIDGLALPDGRMIDLELDPFTVADATTRFVLGREDGEDVPLPFDPSTVVIFRGRAAGYPASHVFLSLAPRSSIARIDLGPGEGRFLMSDRINVPGGLREGELAVVAARSGGGLGLPVPLCRVSGEPDRPAAEPIPADPVSLRGGGPMRGIRQLQLAVDTDNEFFVLFPDAEAAATYIVQLYGIVSDIYIRDVSTRIKLTFVRLWDTPTDPYNVGGNLLGRVGQVFNGMPHVKRDAAQLLSGRVDMNPAGEAWLSALCTSNGVSFCCYALGYLVDPDRPSWTNRDIYITAHELGHNCGSNHTDAYGLDNCHTGIPPARRGSLMSYCGQGYSGSDANYDLWFHEHTANLMRQHIFSRTCIAMDCNGNGEDDIADIVAGLSADANANGVPDECEDCNGNGVLDPADIASGASADINGNLIPDECESDCNGNNIPDAWETVLTPAIDLNRNRIPDSCEGDCDGDGVADYNQIQANMALDVDRNLVLDSCQRCSGPDGPTDFEALDHAWNVYMGSSMNAGVWECHAEAGVTMAFFGAEDVADTQDLLITPDRRILVSSAQQDRIAVFSPGGAHVGTLVPPGAGGLADPACMLITPAGTLLVASRGTNAVLEFDLQTGAFLRTFVQPGAGGLSQPHGLAFGPSGNLFVTSSTNEILEFDGATGDFVRTFVRADTNGGLQVPRGILFGPDGHLLVCSNGDERIIQYDGATGAVLRERWNTNGVPGTLWLEEPWCIRLGPTGNIFVSRAHAHRLHISDIRIFEFEASTGRFHRAYVMGDDTGIFSPSGFDFMPGDATDCNRNLFPDSCDIAQGASRDRNRNGRPDECDCLADWNSSGSVNSTDISAFLTAWLASLADGTLHGDYNDDGTVNSTDISAFLTAWLDALTSGGC